MAGFSAIGRLKLGGLRSEAAAFSANDYHNEVAELAKHATVRH
jgi:hypothetical protein